MRVIQTRLTPPRPLRLSLFRPRLSARLTETAGYRLTILRAGTGYGKSTAVSDLVPTAPRLSWYQLTTEDSDPYTFLSHLIHGLQTAVSGLSEAPLALLEAWTRTHQEADAITAINRLTNELCEQLDQPLFLVLDDAHLLNKNPRLLRLLDRFLGQVPQTLHPILITRYPLELPSLLTWRMRNQVREIDQHELAFTPAETAVLFRDVYHLPLTDEQVALLNQRVEGWPIALMLVRQRLTSGRVENLTTILDDLTRPATDLFAYLAQEVLSQLADDVRHFLHKTAVLSQLTPDLCDRLRGSQDSRQLLNYLIEQGLFIVDLGQGTTRYHHLFRDLLQRQLPPTELKASHLRAATIYLEQEQIETAVYHLLEASSFDEAARHIEPIGRDMLRQGRLDQLAGWLAMLPPETLRKRPFLLILLGDIARLHSRFAEAQGWYQQAEQRYQQLNDARGLGQVLRARARVYIDTVNPSQAEQLLQEALRLSDGQVDRESHARLLDLMVENMLNQGRFKEATAYQTQAQTLRQDGPGEAELPIRLLLRTGRLHEARRLLEKQAQIETAEPVRRPRNHRETLLLLSLVNAMMGEADAAMANAQEGTQRGEMLGSQFVTLVGWARQGHSHLLHKNEAGYRAAIDCFNETIALSETMMIPRLRVEANWGLTQAFGFMGDLPAAEKAANQAVQIAHQAGDEWIAALTRLSLGASYVLAQKETAALDTLAQASAAFAESGDAYGLAVSRLWQCLVWYGRQDLPRLERDLTELLQLVKEHQYSFLFTRTTLLGPPDPRLLVPLLIFARDHTPGETAVLPVSNFASQLLAALGLPQIQQHTGYQLRIQTFGPFRLWRGSELIPITAWRRQKARQLFQFLVTYPDQLIEREQIIDQLWPELDPESGMRDFKTAYTLMCKLLEPSRERQTPSTFILRDGSRYGLHPHADIWLDTAVFTQRVERGNLLWRTRPQEAVTCYHEALVLCEGSYLQAFPYETWASEARERYLIQYLHTAERLARLHLDLGQWTEAITVCEKILAQDGCWENAYRLLMQAYQALGNRSLAVRTYHRCVEQLREELDVPPAEATIALYNELA